MSDYAARSNSSYDHVAEVQSRYTEYLLLKKNVAGVSIGLDDDDDIAHEDTCYCLVVLVTQKVDEDDLAFEDRIPDELDGVPVKVQEIGEISAQGGLFNAGG